MGACGFVSRFCSVRVLVWVPPKGTSSKGLLLGSLCWDKVESWAHFSVWEMGLLDVSLDDSRRGLVKGEWGSVSLPLVLCLPCDPFSVYIGSFLSTAIIRWPANRAAVSWTTALQIWVLKWMSLLPKPLLSEICHRDESGLTQTPCC